MSDEFLSVGLIGPDVLSRLAITRDLFGPEVGMLREYDAYPDLDDVSELIEQKHDVIIIELDSNPEYALELVEKICSCGLSTVMVYSAQHNPELVLRSMRSGAREFLNEPLVPGMMVAALVRASARRPGSHPFKGKLGELFVFFGAKGGVGVTLLASNFAISLAQESGKKTLLIDLDLPLGDIALNLGLTGDHSAVDALQNATRLDSKFLSELLRPYSETLSVLAAPGQFVSVDENHNAIDKLIAVARLAFDYVVVDSGSKFNLFSTDLYKKAAKIYLVTQTGVPELRNSNRFVGQFLPDELSKLEIVINRSTSSFHGLDEETVSKALTRPADWRVPNDYETAFHSQNTGTPLALEDASISQVIRQMARSACGMTESPKKKPRLFGMFK